VIPDEPECFLRLRIAKKEMLVDLQFRDGVEVSCLDDLADDLMLYVSSHRRLDLPYVTRWNTGLK
jgi:hypothetical protein